MRRRLLSTKRTVTLGVTVGVALGLAVGVAGGGEEEQRAKRATVVAARPAPPAITSGKQLDRDEAFTLGVAVTAVRSRCIRNRGTERDVLEHVARLTPIARGKPDDVDETTGVIVHTPRSALAKIVAMAEEDGCAPAVARYARGVLRSLP